MKKILSALSLVLVSISITAQSVLITPGAQSINGDSTSQDQLNVFGNGLLVGPKVKLTENDPASNVHTMSCASELLSESLAGTLKEPTGDADYTAGILYDCSFVFYTYNSSFLAYQIDFESLDTEADGDTVYVLDYYSFEILGSYSGNSLPTSLMVNSNVVRIKFKTDNDANTGAGFVLKWKAILKDGATAEIQNYTGDGLVYDVMSNALLAGKHSLLAFKNKGSYSTAMGYNTAASAYASTAMGYYTAASGNYSTALGNSTAALGSSSTAMGRATNASGISSTALGYFTAASGSYSTAMGISTAASGTYSTAMGGNTAASGNYSTAMGYYTAASGSASTAMGISTAASGTYSTAMGGNTTASGSYSTAMGYNAAASGDYSTAMGNSTAASGSYSTAMGRYTTASGSSSTALGYQTKASGNYSTAIGTRASTNGYEGAMVLSDYVSSSFDSLKADATDRLLARFENGYTFYTDNDLSSATKYGITAHNRANSWSSISDSTKKENFIPSNNDDVLNSVAQMRIGTWNYKGDDTSKNRHWGVMAQDFYHHFGKDAYGTIGNDTSIATADFDGVSFAAIKALEERTRELQNDLASEKSLSASFELTAQKLKKTTEQHEQTIEELKAQLLSMRLETISVRAEARTVQAESKALKEDFKELKEMLLKSVAIEDHR